MSLWDKAVAELIDIIEWTDESSDTLVWRFPRYENEIKQGAQLIVRQAQEAVLVNQGTIADVFAPGRHKLMTENLPVLSTLLGWKYGFHSPFKAEVYFVNTRNFTNLKWGTQNPIMLRDQEFGAVRLRSYGSYVVRVSDAPRFINEIVGTNSHFTVDGVAEQLRNLIVTRFADLLGESKIPVLDLAGNYNELSAFLGQKIAPEFQEYGLEITKLLIENISLPTEVEAALDKRSSMGIIGNLDNYLKFQSANAMEAAAANPGGDASAGIGMGMGFAMANQLGKTLVAGAASPTGSSPPPLPQAAAYFVGADGKQTGPFTPQTVAEQISTGAITRETLLWREGMATWLPAGEYPDFALLLPPPLPK